MNLQGILKVLDRLDIAYVEELSGWVRTACPFAPFRHVKGTDNNPGFGIKIEDDGISHFNCLACKSKGTLATLPMQLAHLRDDMTLIEFGKEIQNEEILGGPIDFGEWDDQSASAEENYSVTNFPNERAFYRDFKSIALYPQAIRYLAERAISLNTAFALSLRYDEKQERILFPVYDERSGHFAGSTGRSILTDNERREIEDRVRERNPKFRNPKIRDYRGLQKDRVLLGARRSNPRKPNEGPLQHRRLLRTIRGTIIVEGLFGYAHTRQSRPRYSVRALLGSALTPGKRRLLLEAGNPIYWLTDNDLAGMSCLYGLYDKEKDEFDHRTGALYQLYGELAQFVLKWPEGKTDPDELTGDELDQMIGDAELFIK